MKAIEKRRKKKLTIQRKKRNHKYRNLFAPRRNHQLTTEEEMAENPRLSAAA